MHSVSGIKSGGPQRYMDSFKGVSQANGPHFQSSFICVEKKEHVRFQEEEILDFEYGEDIQSYMHYIEDVSRPNPYYMESIQRSINWRMRKTLVIWLIEVHKEYNLVAETLYFAVNLIDRFCSAVEVDRSKFQLLGITCLWVAAKYEENHGRVPSIKNLVYMCCSTYTEKEFLAMENALLRILRFNLGHSTSESWLKRFANLNAFPENHGGFFASAKEHFEYSPFGCLTSNYSQVYVLRPEIVVLARYFLEITLVHRRFLLASSSTLAHASLLLANNVITNGVSGSLPFYAYQRHTLDSAFIKDIETFKSFLLECLPDVPKIIFDKFATPGNFGVSVLTKTWLEERNRGYFSGPQLFETSTLVQHCGSDIYMGQDGIVFDVIPATASELYEMGQLTPPKEGYSLAEVL